MIDPGRPITSEPGAERAPHRPESERGAALPIAVSVLLIVLMLTGAAVAYSVRSVDRSNYDRYSARALAAADAGLDVAGYRINKIVLAGRAGGVIGLVNNLATQLDNCTEVDIALAQLVRVGANQDAGWCSEGGWRLLDGEGVAIDPASPTCQPQVGAAFRYFTRLRIGGEVAGDGGRALNDDLLGWEVISVGCSNGRTAVVKGELPMSLKEVADPNNLLRVYGLKEYEQCGGLAFDPAQPAATCS